MLCTDGTAINNLHADGKKAVTILQECCVLCLARPSMLQECCALFGQAGYATGMLCSVRSGRVCHRNAVLCSALPSMLQCCALFGIAKYATGMLCCALSGNAEYATGMLCCVRPGRVCYRNAVQIYADARLQEAGTAYLSGGSAGDAVQ